MIAISDRGPQFALWIFQELCTKLGIKQNLSSTFHPQTNRQSEYVNQDLELYLQIFCNHWANYWVDHLSLAEFVHNNCHHDSIKTSLFKMLMGYNLQYNVPTVGTTDAADINTRLIQLQHLRNEIQSSICVASEMVKRQNKDRFTE